MAGTFTLTSSAYQGRYMELVCTQTKDTATNKSTISWTLSSKGGSSTYYSVGPTTVTINGVQVYYLARKNFDTYVFPAAKGSTSGTLVVDHGTDGSKSISVSMTTVVYYGATSTYSGTWTLDSIPRGATITSAPDFKDTDNPTIQYSNPAGTAPTSLMACISFTGASADVPYRNLEMTGTSYQFPLTESERDTLRNGTTGSSRKLRFYVRTVFDKTNFYSSKEVTFTVTDNDSTKPSVTITKTLNNGSLPSKFDGMCIQGKSRYNVTLSATAKYGASIANYYATVEGKKYNTATFTTDAINGSGSVAIEAYAKDSRGFARTVPETITVTAYSKPRVAYGSSIALCYRSDNNGNRVGNSTSVWIKAQRFYSNPGGENSCSLQWRRKLASEAWNDSEHLWNDLLANASTDEYNAKVSGTFDLDKSYTIQIRAIDDIGEYDIKVFDIPTEEVALHLGAGGKNVSIGAYCDPSKTRTFYSEWTGIFNGGIQGAILNNVVEDVLTFAEQCSNGFYPILTNYYTNTTTLPEGNYRYSVGMVLKRTLNDIVVLLFEYSTGKIAINVYARTNNDTPGGWTGWKYLTPQ